VSQGALNKFVKDNIEKVWSIYDPNKQNQIWIEDGAPFIRELMASPIRKG
jgi:dihydrofolate reductase